jgi:hypothetical protein
MIGPRAAIFAAATSLGISAAVAQIDALPEGPAKTLVLNSCVDCHEADKIIAARHTPDEWAAVVSRMVDHGAALSLGEQATVVNYLSANFGAAAGPSPAPPPTPSTPPPAPVQPSAKPPAESPLSLAPSAK